MIRIGGVPEHQKVGGSGPALHVHAAGARSTHFVWWNCECFGFTHLVFTCGDFLQHTVIGKDDPEPVC